MLINMKFHVTSSKINERFNVRLIDLSNILKTRIKEHNPYEIKARTWKHQVTFYFINIDWNQSYTLTINTWDYRDFVNNDIEELHNNLNLWHDLKIQFPVR